MKFNTSPTHHLLVPLCLPHFCFWHGRNVFLAICQGNKIQFVYMFSSCNNLFICWQVLVCKIIFSPGFSYLHTETKINKFPGNTTLSIMQQKKRIIKKREPSQQLSMTIKADCWVPKGSKLQSHLFHATLDTGTISTMSTVCPFLIHLPELTGEFYFQHKSG